MFLVFMRRIPFNLGQSTGTFFFFQPSTLFHMALPRKLIVIYLDKSVLLPSAVVQATLRGWDAKCLIQKHFATQGRGNGETLQLACIPVTRSTVLPGDTTDHGLFPVSAEGYLHTHGCTGRIVRVERPEDDVYNVLIEGLARFEVLSTEREDGVLTAQIKYVTNCSAHTEKAIKALEDFAALARSFVDTIEQLGMPEELVKELKRATASTSQPVSVLADMLMSLVDVSSDEKLAMLSTPDVSDRVALATRCVTRQLQVLRIGQLHSFQLEGTLTKRQREFYLRHQLELVQNELKRKQCNSEISSNHTSNEDDLAEMKSRIANARLPDHVLKVIEYELNQLDKLHTSSPEWTVLRTYFDVVADLPWLTKRRAILDISLAKKQLDEDHFGLYQAKKRIIEYLSVAKVKGDLKAPILCFVGPPGVGKTSLGKSIAHALARKSHKISLGGVRDEADIRGHRRSYIGAMPGLIIQGIRKCGVNDPVIILDEVDKLARSTHGDPASALLEILDPEQNASFHDHYLNFAYDLSSVLFIATANTVDTIPGPLLDRMEVIHLDGYTSDEKSHIARLHLIPKQLANHGLASTDFKLSDGALSTIIELYTRESGVRTLERTLASVIRVKCVELARMRENNVEHQYVPRVTRRSIPEILGDPIYDKEVMEKQPIPGIVTGLAYSPGVNGNMLTVESTKMPGRGQLKLTGCLGGVLKEAAQIALTWVKIHAHDLRIGQPKENILEHHDIHIHVPNGAVPKNDPSAGAAIVCSLVSLLSESAVMPTTAIAGEISLRGLILPVSGIKEKVIAAHRSGIRKVILPELNRRDLEACIPANVKEDIQFSYVKTIWDVVESAIATPDKVYRSLESHL
ncbi:ATP-dependent protease La [Dichotomocladium elegans]|nr:ATP-dependent protease La [Dichotomocladium elegans]